MKLDMKDLPAKIRSLLGGVGRFSAIIFILFFALIYGFLVQRLGTLTSREPDQSEVMEELNIVRRPKIDEEAVRKIEQLEAQNVEVQTLFEAARRNPFAE